MAKSLPGSIARRKRRITSEGKETFEGTHTMVDIARLAGVSAMTVSRALKADGLVSEETRSRVLKVIEDVGYVPDQTARSFASGKSGFVGAIVPSINNSNFAETVFGLSSVLEAAGRQLLIGASDYSIEREEDLVAAMLRRRPEAMIVTGRVHTSRTRRMLASAKVPVVETWDLPETPIDHVVGFSNAAAAKAMVGYLIGRGYRRIGFIGGATNRDSRGADRRIGFTAAMQAAGLSAERIVTFGQPPISMQQGGEALALLIDRWPDTDAVMCVSDLSAFGALMECHRRGWVVPDRLAIAGFGDFEVARCCHPSMTTVAVDCDAIGRNAGELVLKAIAARESGETLPPERREVTFRVVARETA